MFRTGLAALAPEAQVAFIETESRHLRDALKMIHRIAQHNAEHHTGFVHIARIAAAWLPDPEEPNTDTEPRA